MPAYLKIIPATYHDSVMLMRAAGSVKKLPGVGEAGFFMGSKANKDILVQSGLGGPELAKADTGDLVLSVAADSPESAEKAFAAGLAFLSEKRAAGAGPRRERPASLAAALAADPGLNLALISVPGEHVRREALRAINRGLHVFIFSDNVPVEVEVELKAAAARRDVLCMGPDCGTGWLSGVGLGFANEVPRGRVGMVSASGTGMQEVATHLAKSGHGLSHGIGVGGRDLGDAVGGSMTFRALEFLDRDPGTDLIILVSKPPSPAVMPKLEAALVKLKKPAVVCLLGLPAAPRGGASLVYVPTLVEAARAADAALSGRAREPLELDDLTLVLANDLKRPGRALLGLYTGGTLAHEAEDILHARLGGVAYGDLDAAAAGRHALIDLGDDCFTAGRPHPMIAPETRAEWLRKLGGNPKVGVLLFDLVLGRCSHPEPLTEFLAALAETRKTNPDLAGVATVVGTLGDSQDVMRQTLLLQGAGVVVAHSNAEAALLAALLVA